MFPLGSYITGGFLAALAASAIKILVIIFKDIEPGCISGFISNISNTSDSVSSGYPNTEKRVENTTRSGVFLTKFEVFG